MGLVVLFVQRVVILYLSIRARSFTISDMTRLPSPGGDDNTWGNILNDFLNQAHNSDGSLKASSVTAAGAEMHVNKNVAGGYAGLDSSTKVLSSLTRNGISQQLALIYDPCDLVASVDDLNSFGFYTYDNGSSGVGATITAPANGHLNASGTPVTAGQRIAVHASNIYGSTTDSGIYVVTQTGDAGAPYVLTRSDDNDTAASLGLYFAVQIAADKSTLYFSPEALPFVVGTTHISVAIESLDGYGQGGSTASAQFAHAEGQNSIASGFSSHAEAASIASGYSAHAEGSSDAIGDYSHAEGTSSTQGSHAHSEGNASANGDFSHAEGFSVALGHASHAEGGAVAYANGMHAESGGLSQGQFGRVTRSAFTTDTTPTTLIDNRSQNGFVFRDFYEAAILTVRVLGKYSAGGVVSAWKAQCVVDGNHTNGYRIVGSPAFTLVAQDAGASTWAVADLAFDGSNAAQLNIVVTGAASVPIAWTATIEIDEV